MNLIRILLASLLLAAAPLAIPARAQIVDYAIDPAHTQVDFRWNHLGLSNPSASVDVASGVLRWDAADPTRSSVEVVMPTRSIRTRVPVLDADFHGGKFFDADKYPQIVFRSTRVERMGLGNRFRVHGELTIRGITRPVVLDARLNGAAMHPMYQAPAIGFDATTRVKRSDFGLDVALPMVSDEIEIGITLEGLAKGHVP